MLRGNLISSKLRQSNEDESLDIETELLKQFLRSGLWLEKEMYKKSNDRQQEQHREYKIVDNTQKMLIIKN